MMTTRSDQLRNKTVAAPGRRAVGSASRRRRPYVRVCLSVTRHCIYPRSWRWRFVSFSRCNVTVATEAALANELPFLPRAARHQTVHSSLFLFCHQCLASPLVHAVKAPCSLELRSALASVTLVDRGHTVVSIPGSMQEAVLQRLR